MNSTELSPELQKLIGEIATKNNISNYTVEVTNSVAKEGDGYIGILNGLILLDKDSDKKLDLVVKKAPTNENLRKQFPTRTLFLKEFRMYDEVFPELLAFQEEYNISNPFRSVPKLYGYISDELKEVLLLENMKEDGYRLCKRQEPLDSHHLSLIITEYARLHALSHALRKLKPRTFEKIEKLVGSNVMQEFTSKQNESSSGKPGGFNPMDAMQHFFSPTIQAIENKSPKIKEAVENFKNNCFELMSGQTTDEYSVICHGDCWSANLLFKYGNQSLPKMPTKVCIIDWQMAMLTSPIHDLSYVLCLGAGKDDLENYMRYLHIYHTALSESLTAFGLDVEEIYSFQLLEQNWKETSKTGFMMALVMMQQTLSEGKTHDFEELAKDGQSLFDSTKRNVEVTDLFKQRMGDLVEFLVEHEFL